MLTTRKPSNTAALNIEITGEPINKDNFFVFLAHKSTFRKLSRLRNKKLGNAKIIFSFLFRAKKYISKTFAFKKQKSW